MNSISDEKIELELPVKISAYIKNSGNIRKEIMKKNKFFSLSLYLFCGALLCWNLFAIAYGTELTKDIPKVYSKLFYRQMDLLVYTLPVIGLFVIIRQIFFTRFYFNQHSYLNTIGYFYADKCSIRSVYSNGDFDAKYNWRVISGLSITKQKDIFITISNVYFLILPKETFTSEEQRQQVFDQLTTWHNNAKTTFT